MPRSPRRVPRSTSPSRRQDAMASAGKLRARLAADPEDHEARLELATALFGSGERETAIDELLDPVQARPRMERTGGAQAAGEVFRVDGRHRSADLERAAAVISLMFS